jgi:hypothetical protein
MGLEIFSYFLLDHGEVLDDFMTPPRVRLLH